MDVGWKLNIVKMSLLYKLISRFATILIRIPAEEIDKLILKLHGNAQNVEYPKQSWKINEFEKELSDFKSCKTMVIKTLWYWCKSQQIDQWNKTKASRNRPTFKCFFFFNFSAKLPRQFNGEGKGKRFQKMVLKQLNVSMGTKEPWPSLHKTSIKHLP